MSVNGINKLQGAAGAPAGPAAAPPAQGESGAFQAILDAALGQNGAVTGQSLTEQVAALVQQAQAGGPNSMPLALAARLAEWQALRALADSVSDSDTDANSGTDMLSSLLPLGGGTTLPVTGAALPVQVPAKAPAPAAKVGAAGKAQFLMLKPLFQQAQAQTGVPWQIQAAQWALETGWGSATPKDIATGQESYNLFGIKGQGPAGSVVAMTTEYEGGRQIAQASAFRAYNSFAESILDHARLLTTPYYAPAHAAGQNLQAWADQLGPQHLGYATDPDYAAKLMSIIRENGWG